MVRSSQHRIYYDAVQIFWFDRLLTPENLNFPPEWQDGKIIFQYLATYTNQIFPKSIKNCPSSYNNFPIQN